MAADSTAYRPGVDIGNARLVPCTTWRRRERMETVGEWKTRVYELQNVIFSFKTLAASLAEEELPELKLDEDAEEGFIVAELGNVPARHSCYERGGFGRAEEMEMGRRRSVDAVVPERFGVGSCVLKSKEKEVVKNLKPTVWLTEDFPLKTEELLPMLDILADKIKVVKQLRELLTTKFPPGTFPVKVSIPIIPTVRMIITFTKYISLQPSEQFFTPLSSPRHLPAPEERDQSKSESMNPKSWLKWGSSSSTKSSVSRSKMVNTQMDEHVDPFIIPSDYKWVSTKDKSHRIKTTKSKKGKQKEIW
ncbi:ankyrin repeat domain-containing protein 13C-like [Phalaenopsis equestris]|uniref:ankyrin repeat domain-containing protein 13C-like n=1 Tax=Phalaenopsis equestris TaxID=78828 RepID=UPI0009E4884D|nr:ankyrin repeat domain-containing protein 13C-like [Phalaenopsis equestris]